VALRDIAMAALARTTGSPLVEGNAVRILQDGPENYPAWEEAIEAARRTVHIEMYIFRADRWGGRFAALLARRAAAGVQVRLLCDWFGCLTTPRRLFRDLVRNGGEVRFFNRPHPAAALAVLRRNHRKVISVDGSVSFVSGLCIAEPWMGDAEKGIPPWRDTGVELRGPAVAGAEEAFARSWRHAGGTLPDGDVPARDDIPAAGPYGVRVIASSPETAAVFRMDLLVASIARQRLWLTDAYFMANAPYLQALRRAAADGIDVRILLPSSSDIGWIAAASRTLYGALLDAGVRVYEWRGPMLHAKTAVADGLWTRVGSTNLNAGSWLNNWEMDVSIEDGGIARQMEAAYEADLGNADEIVRGGGQGITAAPHRAAPARRGVQQKGLRGGSGPMGSGSGGQLLREVGNLGSAVGAAVSATRPLESFEYRPLIAFGAALLALALLGFWKPHLVVWPLGLLLAALGLQSIARGLQAQLGQWRSRSRQQRQKSRVAE
jgi:phosphatidylserine/phosphatidylglycerophosphate/cardiolipin synthase-like enzyme